MSYLIDTNIISEVRKGARCDAHVSAWYASVSDEDIFGDGIGGGQEPGAASAVGDVRL